MRRVLSEHQQVAIAVVLVILLAGSLLYCIGFGSVVVREVWEGRAPVLETAEPGIEEVELAPVITTTLTPEIAPALSPEITPALSPEITTTMTPAITATLPVTAGNPF